MNRDEFRATYDEYLTDTDHPDVWGVFSRTAGGRERRYAILDLLGGGGFGNVFLAVDESDRRELVALKLLRPDRDTSQIQRMFQIEDALTQHLSRRSRWVTRWIDHGEFRGMRGGTVRYMATEFIVGRTVRQMLDVWTRIPPLEALRITREVCHGLEEMHTAPQSILHRDIKPANLILVTLHRGETRIIDLGLAVCTRIPRNLRFQGTLEYMAPELFDLEECTIQSDLYSLGCVLYEMLCGHPPIRLSAFIRFLNGARGSSVERMRDSELSRLRTDLPEMPHRVVPGVPESLSELTMRLLQKRPQDRPRSAVWVADRLQDILRDRSTWPSIDRCPDWPQIRQSDVLTNLRDLGRARLHLHESWMVSKSGTLAGLIACMGLARDVHDGLVETRNQMELILAQLETNWDRGRRAGSDREARNSVQQVFSMAVQMANRARSQVTGLPRFSEVLDRLIGCMTRFHDSSLRSLDSGDWLALLGHLLNTRREVAGLIRDSVDLYSMASDRALAEFAVNDP